MDQRHLVDAVRRPCTQRVYQVSHLRSIFLRCMDAQQRREEPLSYSRFFHDNGCLTYPNLVRCRSRVDRRVGITLQT